MSETFYYVTVVEDETDEEVKRLGPMRRARAEKVEDGLGVNLNWDRFHTEIVEQDRITDEDHKAKEPTP
jgi:hypothetical protein